MKKRTGIYVSLLAPPFQWEVDRETRNVSMATVADYETVRELVNAMYVDSSTGATSEVRALIEAVKTLDATRRDGEPITNTTLAKHLGTGVKQVTRRAKRAITLGWLVNREQRKSYPADYTLGEPLPDVDRLPLLAELTTVYTPLPTGIEAKNAMVDRLTPITVEEQTPPLDSKLHGSREPVEREATMVPDVLQETATCNDLRGTGAVEPLVSTSTSKPPGDEKLTPEQLNEILGQ